MTAEEWDNSWTKSAFDNLSSNIPHNSSSQVLERYYEVTDNLSIRHFIYSSSPTERQFDNIIEAKAFVLTEKMKHESSAVHYRKHYLKLQKLKKQHPDMFI